MKDASSGDNLKLMKSVLQTFLKALLLASLVAIPVSASLASTAQAGKQLSTQDIAMVPCYHATQTQAAAGMQQAQAEKMPCTCNVYVDDCTSMDDGGCQHSMVSPLAALPAGAVKFPVMPRDQLMVVFQGSYTGLNVPPESPPPIV